MVKTIRTLTKTTTIEESNRPAAGSLVVISTATGFGSLNKEGIFEMDAMPLPLLAAIVDDEFTIAHDVFNPANNPVKIGFMFSSQDDFQRFTESEREYRASLHAFQLVKLEYRSLLMHLRKASNEAGLDLIIIDYVYEKSPKLNHHYSLFDVKDTIARLSDWGEKTKWGEETERTPGTEKPPHLRAERLTGKY